MSTLANPYALLDVEGDVAKTKATPNVSKIECAPEMDSNNLSFKVLDRNQPSVDCDHSESSLTDTYENTDPMMDNTQPFPMNMPYSCNPPSPVYDSVCAMNEHLRQSLCVANMQIAQLCETQKLLSTQVQAYTGMLPHEKYAFEHGLKMGAGNMEMFSRLTNGYIKPIANRTPSPKDKKVVFSQAALRASEKPAKRMQFAKLFKDAPDIPDSIVDNLVEICVECHFNKDKAEVFNAMFSNGLNLCSMPVFGKSNAGEVAKYLESARMISHMEDMSDA